MKFEVLKFRDRSPDWGTFILGFFCFVMNYYGAESIVLVAGIALIVESWFRGIMFKENDEYLSLADVREKVDSPSSVTLKKVLFITQAAVMASLATFGWLDTIPHIVWAVLISLWPITVFYVDRKWLKKNADLFINHERH